MLDSGENRGLDFVQLEALQHQVLRIQDQIHFEEIDSHKDMGGQEEKV